jgi:hypothetical protein
MVGEEGSYAIRSKEISDFFGTDSAKAGKIEDFSPFFYDLLQKNLRFFWQTPSSKKTEFYPKKSKICSFPFFFLFSPFFEEKRKK